MTYTSIKSAVADLGSEPERAFQTLIRQLELPEPETQFVFDTGGRKWKLDFAWPYMTPMIAVEIHGGVHSRGRHVRGEGFTNDREKMNEAALQGWIVLEFTTEMVTDGRAAAWMLRVFG